MGRTPEGSRWAGGELVQGIRDDAVEGRTSLYLSDMEFKIGVVETAHERDAVFAVRIAVFVEEQRCPLEEEFDAYDATATHFLVRTHEAGEIVATARLVDKGRGMGKIGRVAVLLEYRGRGLGAALIHAIH